MKLSHTANKWDCYSMQCLCSVPLAPLRVVPLLKRPQPRRYAAVTDRCVVRLGHKPQLAGCLDHRVSHGREVAQPQPSVDVQPLGVGHVPAARAAVKPMQEDSDLRPRAAYQSSEPLTDRSGGVQSGGRPVLRR